MGAIVEPRCERVVPVNHYCRDGIIRESISGPVLTGLGMVMNGFQMLPKVSNGF